MFFWLIGWIQYVHVQVRVLSSYIYIAVRGFVLLYLLLLQSAFMSIVTVEVIKVFLIYCFWLKTKGGYHVILVSWLI